MKNIKLYIPNILSTLRLILAFIFPFAFFQKYFYLTIILFIIGSISDLLDGYLARRWNVESKYGIKMDHISDKFFVGMALLSLAIVDNILIFLLFVFEILISGIGIMAYMKSDNFYIVLVGKLKTFFLFITIIVGIFVSIDPNMEIPFWILMGVSAFFQVLTIINYFKLSFSKKDIKKHYKI
ncbi:MAG: CDP-alcohol phosphatidyltransferase family protein [Bacilli bacterium]